MAQIVRRQMAWAAETEAEDYAVFVADADVEGVVLDGVVAAVVGVAR